MKANFDKAMMKYLLLLLLAYLASCIEAPTVQNLYTIELENAKLLPVDSVRYGYIIETDTVSLLKTWADSNNTWLQAKLEMQINAGSNTQIFVFHRVYSKGLLLKEQLSNAKWGVDKESASDFTYSDSIGAKLVQALDTITSANKNLDVDSVFLQLAIKQSLLLSDKYTGLDSNVAISNFAAKFKAAFLQYAIDSTSIPNPNLTYSALSANPNVPFSVSELYQAKIATFEKSLPAYLANSSNLDSNFVLIKPTVTTVDSFYISRFELTYEIFEEALALAPEVHDTLVFGSMNGKRIFLDNTAPLHNISFYQAIALCNKLSKKSGFPPVYLFGDTKKEVQEAGAINYQKKSFSEAGSSDIVEGAWFNIDSLVVDDKANGYRLPTIEEWQEAYAYSTDPNFKFYWGDASDTITVSEYAHIGTAAAKIGSKKPNLLGLYDLSGNVAEWVFLRPSNPNLEADARFAFKGGGYINNESFVQMLRTGLPKSNLHGYKMQPYIGLRLVRGGN